MVAVGLLVVFTLVVTKCQMQPYPFMNTSLSFEERVKVFFLIRMLPLHVRVSKQLQDIHFVHD